MNTQLSVSRMGEHGHGSHQRFGFQADVVVHEQHVRCPTLFTQPHEPARKSACTAKVAIRHHGQVVAWWFVEVYVVGIVHHQHAYPPLQIRERSHQGEHPFHGGDHVRLAVERGDRQTQSNIVRCRRIRTPLHPLYFARAGGNDANVQHAESRVAQRPNREVDRMSTEAGGRHHLLAIALHRHHFGTSVAGGNHARNDGLHGGESPPTSGVKCTERRIEGQLCTSNERCSLVAPGDAAPLANVQRRLGHVANGQHRALQKKLRHRLLIRADRPRTPARRMLLRVQPVRLVRSSMLRESSHPCPDNGRCRDARER